MNDNTVWAIIIGLLIAAGIYILFFWVPPEYRQKSRKTSVMKRLFRIQRLHIFSDDTTCVVAFDPYDAIKAWEEWAGSAWDDKDAPLDQQVQDTANIKILYEPDDLAYFKRHRPPFSKIGQDKSGYSFITAPAWLWCLWNGRGFLCSEEF